MKLLGMKLVINREWSYNNNYWSTGNEVRTTPIDQQGMKLEQQPIDRTTTIDQQGMKLEQQLLINREWS